MLKYIFIFRTLTPNGQYSVYVYHLCTTINLLYRSSQVSLARIEELRAVIEKQELEMENLKASFKEQLNKMVYFVALKKMS